MTHEIIATTMYVYLYSFSVAREVALCPASMLIANVILSFYIVSNPERNTSPETHD